MDKKKSTPLFIRPIMCLQSISNQIYEIHEQNGPVGKRVSLSA